MVKTVQSWGVIILLQDQSNAHSILHTACRLNTVCTVSDRPSTSLHSVRRSSLGCKQKELSYHYQWHGGLQLILSVTRKWPCRMRAAPVSVPWDERTCSPSSNCRARHCHSLDNCLSTLQLGQYVFEGLSERGTVKIIYL